MSPRFAPITLCYLDSRLVAFLRQFLLQAPRILKLLLQQQNPLLGLNLLKIATRHWWLFDFNTSTELYLLTLFLSFLIAEYKLCKMYVKFHYFNINFSTQLFLSNFFMLNEMNHFLSLFTSRERERKRLNWRRITNSQKVIIPQPPQT